MKKRKYCRNLIIVFNYFMSIIALSIFFKINWKQNLWTRKRVNKKIVGLTKKIKIYQKKNRKAKKGKIFVSGEIISRNPIIIKSRGLFSDCYYKINNPEKFGCWITVGNGWVKRTGEYSKYGEYICTDVTAVLVKSYDEKLETLKRTREKYKRAFACVPYADNISLQVGDKKKIEVFWSDEIGGKLNLCKFCSLNTSIITVNENGVIEAHSTGNAEIILEGSVSGECSVVRVCVK